MLKLHYIYMYNKTQVYSFKIIIMFNTLHMFRHTVASSGGWKYNFKIQISSYIPGVHTKTWYWIISGVFEDKNLKFWVVVQDIGGQWIVYFIPPHRVTRRRWPPPLQYFKWHPVFFFGGFERTQFSWYSYVKKLVTHIMTFMRYLNLKVSDIRNY